MEPPRHLVAVLAGIVLLTGCQSGSEKPTGSTLSPNGSSTRTSPPPSKVAVPIYYVGNSVAGPRLFRESTHVNAGTRLLAAVRASVDGDAADGDYRSAWPAGTVVTGVHFDGVGDDGLLQVVLADAGIRHRPSGTSTQEAALAIQQVVHTAQEAAGARAPVQFFLDNSPVDQVLGIPLSEPVDRDAVLDTLNLVSLDLPVDGIEITAGTLEVAGAANGYEGNVVLELARLDGTTVVGPMPLIAGFGEDRLFPFARSLDISGLPPGSYRLTATTEDPREGHEAFTDDRVVVIG